eukprot:899625-Prorocentrum_minimum.AAC.1
MPLVFFTFKSGSEAHRRLLNRTKPGASRRVAASGTEAVRVDPAHGGGGVGLGPLRGGQDARLPLLRAAAHGRGGVGAKLLSGRAGHARRARCPRLCGADRAAAGGVRALRGRVPGVRGRRARAPR